jgi:radical SAM superfamily enzyme YgiQ (UPF0313 family)
MRYARALFVTPYCPGRYFGGVRPPVGIAYVEEFVSAAGVRTDAVDMTMEGSLRHLLRRIDETQPAVVGFTVMTYQYRHVNSLISEVKKRFPDTKVVIGGAHVCGVGAEALRQCPAADFAVAGEGEIPMRDLCLGRPLEGIPGLLYRGSGAILSGGPPQLVEDLDSLPFPRFASYPLRRYTDEIEIVTSRGCPHGCIFCAVSSIMGRGVRYRSPRSVGDELEYFYRLGVRGIQFGDDNFLAHRPRILEILGEIETRNLKELVLRCGQGIRADLLDREILVAMKKAGFRHLGIGVESASDRVLAVIGKHESVERIEHGVALACELGFDVSLFFVVGTPTETLADVERSVALARKYPVMKAFFFNLVPFPGTRLYEWVREHDALVGSYEELINRQDELKLRSKPFFATAEMTEAERIRALQMTERASRDIRIRALRRKFSRLGPMGALIAQAGRFDIAERLFIRHRRLRRFLDKVMFGSEWLRLSGRDGA